VPKKTIAKGPVPQGIVSMPEEAIGPEMFKADFKFERGWLEKNPETAARLALKSFEVGEADALIQLVEARSPLPNDVLHRLGALLAGVRPSLLRAVAASRRNTTGRKPSWRKYPKLFPVIARHYDRELALAQASDKHFAHQTARERAATAVAEMPALNWLKLTPSAVLSIVTGTRKERKNVARRNAP
jgi:hypothetical protein